MDTLSPQTGQRESKKVLKVNENLWPPAEFRALKGNNRGTQRALFYEVRRLLMNRKVSRTNVSVLFGPVRLK